MTEIDNQELHLITSSRDLDDYDVLIVGNISAAIPHEATESLRRFIWGSLVTYQFGNTSIDHVLRRYDYLWERYKADAKGVDPHISLLRTMVKKVNDVSIALEAVEVSGTVAEVCVKSALCRLEATFKAAYGLIRKDYVFETDSVIRLILEQLAWSCKAKHEDDDKILSIKPTKCISSLKRYMGNAGNLYGKLSETAHIDPSLLHNYLRFHEGRIPVVRRSEENAIASGEHLLELAVVYSKVAQELFKPYSDAQWLTVNAELTQLLDRYRQQPQRA